MSYFLHVPQSVPGRIKVNTSIGLFGSYSTSDPVRRSLFTTATSLNSKFTSTPDRTASVLDSSAAPFVQLMFQKHLLHRLRFVLMAVNMSLLAIVLLMHLILLVLLVVRLLVDSL